MQINSVRCMYDEKKREISGWYQSDSIIMDSFTLNRMEVRTFKVKNKIYFELHTFIQIMQDCLYYPSDIDFTRIELDILYLGTGGKDDERTETVIVINEVHALVLLDNIAPYHTTNIKSVVHRAIIRLDERK